MKSIMTSSKNNSNNLNGIISKSIFNSSGSSSGRTMFTIYHFQFINERFGKGRGVEREMPISLYLLATVSSVSDSNTVSDSVSDFSSDISDDNEEFSSFD